MGPMILREDGQRSSDQVPLNTRKKSLFWDTNITKVIQIMAI